MLFLVRCVFWLGIVFSALPWSMQGWNIQGWNSNGSSDMPARLLEATRSAAPSAPGLEYVGLAGDYCAKAPLECLNAARQLQDLFERVKTEGDGPAGPPLAATPPPTLKAQDKTPRWRAAAIR